MTEPVGVPPIDLAIETPADPGTAWQAITVPERIALWFTDASPLGPVGSPYRLDFGDGSVVAGEVLEVEPGDVATVEWTVEPLPDRGSRVRLVHSGWEASGDDATTRDEHEAYWTGYLDDLRDILGEA